MKTPFALLPLALLALVPFDGAPSDGPPAPIAVYVLAGQSNAEGFGHVRSLPALADERPDLLARLRAPDGAWLVRDDVFVRWAGHEPESGPLGVGWGRSAEFVGPELALGTVLGDAHDEPVLIVKVAFGGADLTCDFRSPAAGAPSEGEAALLGRHRREGREREVGARYRQLVHEVRDALERVDELVPGSEGRGHRLAGLVWFQGWNDFCEWHVEEDGVPIGRAPTERYADNLAALVRDLRRELAAPDLPVVVGELGVGGEAIEERVRDGHDHEALAMAAFRRAQRAACEERDLRGVTFVRTAHLWDARLDALREQHERWWHEQEQRGVPEEERTELPTPELVREYRRLGGHWYCHYNGSAPTYCRIGEALALPLVGSPPARRR